MFIKNIQKKLFIASAMLTALCLASCIDNDYDLDNVDLTIGSKVNLTLPSSSTGEIQLKNLIDLKEDGVVQLVPNPNGDGDMYVVCEDGVANIDPVNIGEIDVTKPKLDDFDATVDLENLMGGGHSAPKKAPSYIPISVGGKTVNLKLEDVYRYTLEEGDACTEIKDAVAANVSEDICRLDSIKWADNALTLKLSLNGVPSFFKRIHLDGFELNLPDQLTISSCTVDDKPVSIVPVRKYEGHQILRLTADSDVLGHSFLEPLVLKLGFSGAKIVTETAEEPAPAETCVVFDASSHKVQFSGRLSVTGNFRILTSEMDQEQLVKDVVDELMTWPIDELMAIDESLDLSSLHNVFPQSLHFTGENGFADDIRITKVSGEFMHKVGAIDPIELNDLPDFLNDPEVVLDLDNPMVFISTSTTLPAEAMTAISLVSKVGEKTVERHTDEIVLTGSKVFWMANREEKLFVPEQYTKEGVNLIYTPLLTYDETQSKDVKADVTGLIKTIPDQINVDVAEVRLKAKDLDITKEYDVNVDYHVYAPLSFGPEFSLVYQDTETGFDLGDDLDDLTISNDAVIELDAQVVSTLPTKCTLTIIPLNKEKEVLSIIKPITLSVGAHANGTKIHAEIEPIGVHTIQEALHSGPNQLDGIKFKAVLDEPVSGEGLTDKGSIVIKNMKLHVKAGVSYDAN